MCQITSLQSLTFPEDEKAFTANLLQMNGIVQEKFEVVESQAKRMRMEALQRKPSDEVTTAAQLAAQVQPSPKTSKSVDVAVEKAAGSAPIAPVRQKRQKLRREPCQIMSARSGRASWQMLMRMVLRSTKSRHS